MLRSLLHFRCGQSQELAPRESPQIIHLPQQQFCHHLWGTLRRWQYDGYNNISQIVITATTVYDGTNTFGMRYTTWVIHSITIRYTIHLVHSISYVLRTTHVLLVYIQSMIYNNHHIQLQYTYYMRMVFSCYSGTISFYSSFFHGALPVETPNNNYSLNFHALECLESLAFHAHVTLDILRFWKPF